MASPRRNDARRSRRPATTYDMLLCITVFNWYGLILRCKWLIFILRLWILHPSLITEIIIYIRDVLDQGSVRFMSYRRMLIHLPYFSRLVSIC